MEGRGEDLLFERTEGLDNMQQPETQTIIDNPPDPSEVRCDKQLRKDLDQSLQNLKSLYASRERALALKRLHEPNPYPASYDPTSPRIEPVADGLSL